MVTPDFLKTMFKYRNDISYPSTSAQLHLLTVFQLYMASELG